jgi:L-seryl-tRNA(Ser) seleniumtransferase
MDDAIREALRGLPSVDEASRQLEALCERTCSPRWALVQAVRDEIAALREQALAGRPPPAALDAAAVERRMHALLVPSLRPVLNATGVVLHTNLGRAPLAAEALARVARVAAGYSTLEYELAQRRRGSRHVHAAALLRQLSGAEDALVVNNNAAAVLLGLAALARGREVVVSRGELIEIGGSFRLPDVMAASGAMLREVGTTNRTHLRDYEQAINEATGLLLKAHRSNFALLGFTAEVDPEELVALGRARAIPTMFDLGSGSLVDLHSFGLPREPTVQQAVAQGFDLVSFSGDKVLGGPQAGILVGRGVAIGKLRVHPLLRALRPGKLTLAALEATLEAYRDGVATERLPALVMLATPASELRRRARRLRALLRRGAVAPWDFPLREVVSQVGGGALPQAAPPSWAVAVVHPRCSPQTIEERLRLGEPPVLGRIEEDELLLDVRTVPDEQIVVVARAVAAAIAAIAA